MPKSSWFPYVPEAGTKTSDTDTVTIFCLPHAGAGASVYRAWGSTAPNILRVVAVQPPGRENRVREPAHRDAAAFTRDLLPALRDQIDGPYSLFGHSTGAMTAFELIRALRRDGAPRPRHLFVSGRRSPDQPMPRTPVGTTDLAGLRDILQRLGGTPEEVLDEPELLAHLQPLLAADFRLNEEYAYYDEAPLDVPITAFSADADAGAGPAEMIPWGRHTSGSFDHVPLSGGHFAVFEQSAHVQATMARLLLAPPDRSDPLHDAREAS